MLKQSGKRSLFYALMASALFTNAALAQQTATLKILWEVNTGSDYMTAESTTERDLYTNRGALMYVPYGSIAGTVPLYRLWNGSSDHMTSHVAGEGGYTTEGVLGWVWNNATAVRGLGRFNRLVNPTTNDHAEVKAGDNISGYTVRETPGIYGYPRYNNVAESLLSLSAGGITVKSNKVAGGSIWSWVWNGIEFVDHADYGREIQSDMDWTAGGVLYNPTEAGSKYSTDPVVGNRQGSPLYSASNSGNTQSTRAIPLQWNPDILGGSATRPVIFTDMLLGKDVTLNYNNMGSVAKYVTHLTLASPVSQANLSLPAAYAPASFGKYYTYDAHHDTLLPATPGCGTGTGGGIIWLPNSGHGAVIIENDAGTGAIAVAGRTAPAGGKVGGFGLSDCRVSNGTSIYGAFTGHVAQSAGTTSITTFIVTDTLANVRTKIRQLYIQGDI